LLDGIFVKYHHISIRKTRAKQQSFEMSAGNSGLGSMIHDVLMPGRFPQEKIAG
jgi:hypothetical protein